MTCLIDIDKEVGLDGRDGRTLTVRDGEGRGGGGAGSGAGAAVGGRPSMASSTPPSGICQGNSSADLFSADQSFDILANHVWLELRPWPVGGFGCLWRVLLIRQTVTTATIAIKGPSTAKMVMVGLELSVLGVAGGVDDTANLVLVGDGARVTLTVTMSVAVELSVAL